MNFFYFPLTRRVSALSSQTTPLNLCSQNRKRPHQHSPLGPSYLPKVSPWAEAAEFQIRFPTAKILHRNCLFLDQEGKLTRLRKRLVLALSLQLASKICHHFFPSNLFGFPILYFRGPVTWYKNTFHSVPTCLNNQRVFALSESKASPFCFFPLQICGADTWEALSWPNAGKRAMQGLVISQASWERKNMNLLTDPVQSQSWVTCREVWSWRNRTWECSRWRRKK